MKLNQLDSHGFFEVDHVEGEPPDNWTADLVGNGYYKAQYQNGSRDPETGEWTGGKWVETSGPSAEDIESVKESLIAIADFEKASLMSHASDMIGAIADEIEGLEDSDDAVPDTLRTDLKAWKQYRVKVKNIDVSLAPNIEWTPSPEQNNLTAVDISELTR
ncbi:tail fiber assembly protein [Yersinia aleksiciae]|uniref:tail fiber assembly protein n=1 Tax=Yersinia aleksiciae TaxID=263819 RepID=UPI00119E1169|nr:tail fiber assembly protein [Yersinia aleksiciae]